MNYVALPRKRRCKKENDKQYVSQNAESKSQRQRSDLSNFARFGTADAFENGKRAQREAGNENKGDDEVDKEGQVRGVFLHKTARGAPNGGHQNLNTEHDANYHNT